MGVEIHMIYVGTQIADSGREWRGGLTPVFVGNNKISYKKSKILMFSSPKPLTLREEPKTRKNSSMRSLFK
jgi:hypothetical protein